MTDGGSGVTRERDRYPRMTLRDQLEELLDWVRGHPLVVVAVVIVAVYVVTQLILPSPTARLQDLRVGDCLYVRTSASTELGSGVRPIGDATAVGASLLSGGADRAGCDASHGHEVSALIDLAEPPSMSPTSPALDIACDGVFESYVGHAPGSSLYETYAVVPGAPQWDAGIHRAVCLIARADGQWMDRPARGSGE
jgi:hypothetical protein